MTSVIDRVRRSRRNSTPRSDDRGDTLIEVLAGLAILGITATALLGALTTAISSSGEHRGFAEVDALLKSYAENATYQIELQPSPIFSDCSVNSSFATSATYYQNHVSWTYPTGYTSGYTITITSVAPWNSSNNAFDTGTTCATTDVTGVQQLTILGTGPGNAKDTMTFIVRNPTFESSYAARF